MNNVAIWIAGAVACLVSCSSSTPSADGAHSGGTSSGAGGTDVESGGGTTTDGVAGTTGGAGASASGGTPAVDDSGGSGNPGSGGSASGSNRARTILEIDRDWLFFRGDASGAEQPDFSDDDWVSVDVPHDFSIEGPFDEGAATTGRGGYLPSGVGWYRKHFVLPDELAEKRISIEFDGVMANSDVFINGAHLGHHPNGYVSFVYDMSDDVAVGGMDNVIAVKTDTSLQPASRYYTGAGIYRHVRLIATDELHIDQWATRITTIDATSDSATVHVETSIENASAYPAQVALEAILRDGGSAALSPVAVPAKEVAAGATAAFSFDIEVESPKLWSPDAPNMYELELHVQIDGTTIDDEITPFGIRDLVFDAATGLSINGKETKFQGVCLHQDYHGLGLAAPLRAKQRRLAQLKLYGVNAIRISHDSPDPQLLDLCDRMGILVMNEFFDVWTGHKYSDVGDYATYFDQKPTTATGMPAVPGGVADPSWFEVDVTGVVMRTRNHPSLALYSAGNEIRESIGTRTPILTRIAEIVHALDPTRPLTQALFRPQDSGDVDGPTRTLLDVFGGNYRPDEVVAAMKMTPARAGVITEITTDTSTWTTVMANPALTGLFMWTGLDYLGEQPDGWPTVGSDFGILDAMGNPKAAAFSWQTVWGAPTTAFSTDAVAGSIVLSTDHSEITTDLDDVAFVRAAVEGDQIPITFGVEGPGKIIAVDSANLEAESFRGTVRNSYGGLAYAIVQATGSGTITVTAQSPGLSDGSATIQAIDAPFLPCTTSCD